MWESPVNIYETISYMVEKEIDGNIIVEIKKQLGIDINKDELIKALQYDRNQYEKGYQDGLNADKWINIDDRFPEERQSVLVYCPCRKNIYCAYLEKDQWRIFGAYSKQIKETVTKWKPLPSMPKE